MNYLRCCCSFAAVLCSTENRIQAAAAVRETENFPAVATIRALEERVEDATVSGDTSLLEKVFGDDFI
jgi:hypothetical protein